MGTDDGGGFERVEAGLRGTTLRVYWNVLKAGRPLGVRELQRLLGFASPSTALHHLEKLRSLGVLGKDEYGRYIVRDEVKVGVLRMFLRFGRLMLPRYLFYAGFFGAALLFYLLGSYIEGEKLDSMAIIFGFGGLAVSVYETVRVWRDRLF